MMNFGSNSDITGIFAPKKHLNENQEYGEESPVNEYVLEKDGDEYEESVYEDTPDEHDELDEIIPEEPVKKERTKKESQESKDNSPKFSVTAKIDSEQRNVLSDIEDAYGVSTSQALIQCIECFEERYGVETKSIAKKIRKIRNKQ